MYYDLLIVIVKKRL